METRPQTNYVEVVLPASVPVDDEEPRDTSAVPAGLPLGRVRLYADEQGETYGVRLARRELVPLLSDLVAAMTPDELERVQRVITASV